MKLFNVLPKYLTAFNYAGLNLNENLQELKKVLMSFKTLEKECRKNPTNQIF